MNWSQGYNWPPPYMIMQAPNSNDRPPDMPKPDKKEKTFVDILRETEEQQRELDRYLELRKKNKTILVKEEKKKKWWKFSEVLIAFSFGSLLMFPLTLLIFIFVQHGLTK